MESYISKQKLNELADKIEALDKEKAELEKQKARLLIDFLEEMIFYIKQSAGIEENIPEESVSESPADQDDDLKKEEVNFKMESLGREINTLRIRRLTPAAKYRTQLEPFLDKGLITILGNTWRIEPKHYANSSKRFFMIKFEDMEIIKVPKSMRSDNPVPIKTNRHIWIFVDEDWVIRNMPDVEYWEDYNKPLRCRGHVYMYEKDGRRQLGIHAKIIK